MGIYRLHLCAAPDATTPVNIIAVDGADDDVEKIQAALPNFTHYTSYGVYDTQGVAARYPVETERTLGLTTTYKLASASYATTHKVQGNGQTLIKQADGGQTFTTWYGYGGGNSQIGLKIQYHLPSPPTVASSQYYQSAIPTSPLTLSTNVARSKRPSETDYKNIFHIPVLVLSEDVNGNPCIDTTHFYECDGLVKYHTNSQQEDILDDAKWVVRGYVPTTGSNYDIRIYAEFGINERVPIDEMHSTRGQYQYIMSLVERFEKISGGGGGSGTQGNEQYNNPNNPSGAAYPAQGYRPDGSPINLFQPGATGGVGGNGTFEEWRDDTQATETEGLPSYLGGQDTTPDVTSTGIFSIYQLSSTQLTQLNEKLWDTSFWQSMQNTNLNPLETVISLYKCKIPVESDGSSTIVMGMYSTGMTGAKCKQYKKITLPDIEIKRYYDSWLDQNPHTQLCLYLPYIGLVDINADYYMGRNLRIEYVFDFLSSTCIAKLYTLIGDTPTLVETKQGQFGMQIPLTATRRESVLNSFLQITFGGAAVGLGLAMAATGFGAAAGAATASAGLTAMGTAAGGIAAAGVGAQQAANGLQGMNKFSYQIASHIQANASFMSSNKVYLFRSLPSVQLPENYNQLVGNTAYVSTSVENLKGLSVVKNLKLDNVAATLAEKEELKQIFLSGVYM